MKTFRTSQIVTSTAVTAVLTHGPGTLIGAALCLSCEIAAGASGNSLAELYLFEGYSASAPTDLAPTHTLGGLQSIVRREAGVQDSKSLSQYFPLGIKIATPNSLSYYLGMSTGVAYGHIILYFK